MKGNKNKGYVFGLDIGTRSIVGTVGYRVGTDRFIVVAQEAVEHTTRAVIDGQIHDIPTVARTISDVKNRLENRIRQELSDVSIAAAGRVLKTRMVHVEMELPADTKVQKEHIRSLDMMGMEQAYAEIRKDTDDADKHFFCVGCTTVRYYLNGYPMEMIELHPANSIGEDLLATFLPEEVVDGLYSAVEEAGLQVASLTLEPIAAINVAIPEKYRLLNIALVDVGAGTSDISIVKDGSIIAFGMIPLAGDELTEAIARNYLTDFETAEKVKRECAGGETASFQNIFGDTIEVESSDIVPVCQDVLEDITKNIADQIIHLNGDKSVSAVFVVGGGGKHTGFTEKLAQYLGLPKERVALRGAEVLLHVEFQQEDLQKDSRLVTPIGICMSYYEQQNNFIHVNVNDQRVKLYDNGKVTVLDACISSGFSQSNLFPVKGNSLRYHVNGEERTAKGKSGEVAYVQCNGVEVSLNELVKENDDIVIRPSTKGSSARLTLAEIPECKKEIQVGFFGRNIVCPVLIEVNGRKRGLTYRVQQDDHIEVQDYYTVGGLFEFCHREKKNLVLLNGKSAGMTAKVHDGDVVAEKIKAVKHVKSARENRKEFHRENHGENHREIKRDPEPKETAVKEKKQPEKRVLPAEEPMDENPLLQPQKPLPEWMEDVPFDTPKRGVGGKIIPGVASPPPSPSGNKPAKPAPVNEPVKIRVNGQDVTMPSKAHPIFVDVFDVYPFDMTKAGGTRLVTRINGEDKDFTEPVHSGDEIELYWEK